MKTFLIVILLAMLTYNGSFIQVEENNSDAGNINNRENGEYTHPMEMCTLFRRILPMEYQWEELL